MCVVQDRTPRWQEQLLKLPSVPFLAEVQFLFPFWNHSESAQSFANSQFLFNSDFRESKQPTAIPKERGGLITSDPQQHNDRWVHRAPGACTQPGTHRALGASTQPGCASDTQQRLSPPLLPFPRQSALDSVPDPWLVSNSLILWVIKDNDGNIFPAWCASAIMTRTEIS